MNKGPKETSNSRKVRVIISIISCFILFILGVFTLVVGESNSPFVPTLLAIGGFIGFLGGLVEIKKMNAA
jgi:lipopolysaccharide export LptBFGC system permease protein LptF